MQGPRTHVSTEARPLMAVSASTRSIFSGSSRWAWGASLEFAPPRWTCVPPSASRCRWPPNRHRPSSRTGASSPSSAPPMSACCIWGGMFAALAAASRDGLQIRQLRRQGSLRSCRRGPAAVSSDGKLVSDPSASATLLASRAKNVVPLTGGLRHNGDATRSRSKSDVSGEAHGGGAIGLGARYGKWRRG
jgi:hypothetical protein